jgi:hypothetical protein
MAARKKAKKKVAKKAPKRRLTPAQRERLRIRAIVGAIQVPDFGDPCSLANLCAYVEALSTFFKWFDADYKALRKAVCNVERRAWQEPNDPGLRFCQGGASDEPLDPPPTPKW